MFKLPIILLMSLFVTPSAINIASGYFDGPQNVLNDPEPEEKTYEYEEMENPNGSGILRIYDAPDLAPTIRKHFCAPSGYAFTSEISDAQIDGIMKLIDDDKDYLDPTYKMPDMIYRYEFAGSEVYVDSFPKYTDAYADIDARRDETRDIFKDNINGHLIFKVGTIIEATTIVPIYDFCIDSNEWYQFTLRFVGQPITVEPFDATDFIDVRIDVYEQSFFDDREARMGISANLYNGFFCQTDWYDGDPYNEYGFHTDDTEPAYDSILGDQAYYAVYDLELIANDTVVMASLGNKGGGIEMTYPTEPLPAIVRLTFISRNIQYTYYSKPFVIGDPNISIYIDGYANRSYIQRGVEHEFRLHVDNLKDDGELGDATRTPEVAIAPLKLNDEENGVELYQQNGVLPTVGQTGKYYYIPSDNELALYRAKQYEELENMDREGQYKIWNSELEDYEDLRIVLLKDDYNADPDETPKTVDEIISAKGSIPFIGKWHFEVNCYIETPQLRVGFVSVTQIVNVVASDPSNSNVTFELPESLNLVASGGSVEIDPTLIAEYDDTICYYSHETNRNGVIDVEQDIDGKLTITPLNAGLVTLTVDVESQYFLKQTREITIHVVDNVYDNAVIEVPNEFHYASKDLTASINIRGFTSFPNLNIDWNITRKNGKALIEEEYVDNKDATVTILEAESDDYTIKASYEGIELGEITVQVRYVNINLFLRHNIWWIFLITIGFVVLIFFFRHFTKRGHTAVQRIERVYDVYCACLSDDKLTKEELTRIKREISRCLHWCEDLNIEALNQYEKSIRYLRKSLNDSKTLLNQWETITPEDRSVFSDRLDKDLSKALGVAKEIENAKDLIEEYHSKANKQNYEVIRDDNDEVKKRKK